jgi:O-antigen/teichoic acid export membrane protein
MGTVLPMLTALIAVPVLIEELGTPRFGVLTLVWMVVGYFSLFDLGLGRALTHVVAEKLGRGTPEEIPAIMWTGMLLLAGLGIVAAVLIFAATPWLVERLFKMPDELRAETVTAFYLMSVSVPFVILTSGLRGVLEANQRFGLINAVRLPLGVLTYLGPVAVVAYSASLPAVVLVLLIARAAMTAVYGVMCFRLHPRSGSRNRVARSLMKRLLSFGGWMTVSNIVGPLLVHLGRVLIAALISAEAVAYFSVSYDVLTNLLVIPGVLISVLFPAFTQLLQSSPAATRALYKKAAGHLLAIMLPLAVAAILLAKPALSWWINDDFAENGYRVAQLLGIGVLINSFGHLSGAIVQAFGRPDLTAKLHVAELVLYVPYLWWLVGAYGIDGAAIAWVVRVSISTVVLYVIADRIVARAVAGGPRALRAGDV